VRSLLVPLGIALPLLAVALWLAVGMSLRPLRNLGSEVATRDPGNLAPLHLGVPPAEVAPLVDNLNRLFARVRESIEHEKRFTADAAHELRTPIAALRAQAQVALGAASDGERQRALAQVIAGCDRATRLVAQLLTLARLEPASADRPTERCDLVAIARDVVAESAPAALAKSIDIALDAPASAPVRGNAGLLAVLVRNLVDNAIRYCPAGATVRIVIVDVATGVELRVADNGPGVPPETLARLGERFFRQPGRSEPGSGLGLSIVRRIAELHDAPVAFGANAEGNGLVVSVRFRAERHVPDASFRRAGPRISPAARPATPGSPD
jgi:two-component system sensor histidine kinase QseC